MNTLQVKLEFSNAKTTMIWTFSTLLLMAKVLVQYVTTVEHQSTVLMASTTVQHQFAISLTHVKLV
jgi:hypothetical protein